MASLKASTEGSPKRPLPGSRIFFHPSVPAPRSVEKACLASFRIGGLLDHMQHVGMLRMGPGSDRDVRYERRRKGQGSLRTSEQRPSLQTGGGYRNMLGRFYCPAWAESRGV